MLQSLRLKKRWKETLYCKGKCWETLSQFLYIFQKHLETKYYSWGKTICHLLQLWKQQLRRLADKFCLHCNIFIYNRHIWIKPVLCSRMVSLFHHTSPWTHRCLQASHSSFSKWRQNLSACPRIFPFLKSLLCAAISVIVITVDIVILLLLVSHLLSYYYTALCTVCLLETVVAVQVTVADLWYMTP